MERSVLSFGRVADVYDSTREAPPPDVVEALVRQLAVCRSVLDLGTGTGRLARPLLDRGVHIVGLDVSSRMLQVAVGKGLDRAVVGDVCELPFRSQSFDAILAVHVMHLVADLSLLFREARRVGRGLLVTLADRWDPSDNPMDGYYEALTRRGFQARIGPERLELPLAEVIEPTVYSLALATEVTGDFGPLLGILERREYTMTWDVPDDLHTQAMSEVKQRYVGPRPPTRRETFVLGWDIASLTDDALRRVRERFGVSAVARAGGSG